MQRLVDFTRPRTPSDVGQSTMEGEHLASREPVLIAKEFRQVPDTAARQPVAYGRTEHLGHS